MAFVKRNPLGDPGTFCGCPPCGLCSVWVDPDTQVETAAIARVCLEPLGKEWLLTTDAERQQVQEFMDRIHKQKQVCPPAPEAPLDPALDIGLSAKEAVEKFLRVNKVVPAEVAKPRELTCDEIAALKPRKKKKDKAPKVEVEIEIAQVRESEPLMESRERFLRMADERQKKFAQMQQLEAQREAMRGEQQMQMQQAYRGWGLNPYNRYDKVQDPRALLKREYAAFEEAGIRVPKTEVLGEQIPESFVAYCRGLGMTDSKAILREWRRDSPVLQESMMITDKYFP